MADENTVKATARFIPMSARKVRLVVDLVRGMDAEEAMVTLKFTHKAAAHPIEKVLRSAIANAEENFGISRDELFVHNIFADEGPTRRWRRFGARGRYKPILRRTSHIIAACIAPQHAPVESARALRSGLCRRTPAKPRTPCPRHLGVRGYGRDALLCAFRASDQVAASRNPEHRSVTRRG